MRPSPVTAAWKIAWIASARRWDWLRATMFVVAGSPCFGFDGVPVGLPLRLDERFEDRGHRRALDDTELGAQMKRVIHRVERRPPPFVRGVVVLTGTIDISQLLPPAHHGAEPAEIQLDRPAQQLRHVLDDAVTDTRVRPRPSQLRHLRHTQRPRLQRDGDLRAQPDQIELTHPESSPRACDHNT